MTSCAEAKSQETRKTAARGGLIVQRCDVKHCRLRSQLGYTGGPNGLPERILGSSWREVEADAEYDDHGKNEDQPIEQGRPTGVLLDYKDRRAERTDRFVRRDRSSTASTGPVYGRRRGMRFVDGLRQGARHGGGRRGRGSGVEPHGNDPDSRPGARARAVASVAERMKGDVRRRLIGCRCPRGAVPSDPRRRTLRRRTLRRRSRGVKEPRRMLIAVVRLGAESRVRRCRKGPM